jgi:tetratricopeptide (TPR) repeat protein
MNWSDVTEDTYYYGRWLESEARHARKPAGWEKYAEVKVSKASYLMASLGYARAADLYELEGGPDRALECYDQALELARKAASMDLIGLMSIRIAELHQRAGDLEACFEAYDRLGDLATERGLPFLAADAFDHAAEILAMSGGDVQAYEKPLSAWEKNAQYWEEQGEQDDAEWSRRRIELFGRLHGLGEK